MTGVGSVYGQALYALAKEEHLLEVVYGDLQVLKACFEAENEYLVLLSAANISVEERCQVVDEAFRDRVHPYVLNFLKVLTEKGYAREFNDCFISFEKQYHIDNDILPIKAVSAVPLSEEQTAKLIAKLSSMTGKNIKLIKEVLPECKGGVRLDFEGKRLDDTILKRLTDINQMLTKTVL